MDHHLRIKVVVADLSNSNDDEPTPMPPATRPFVAPPPPVLFRESAFSRPILPATSSLLLPPAPKPPAAGPERYRECLRNHAASLGAHVVDGCGEFMPRGPAEPLRCAACGCHRSFHRKEQPEHEAEDEPALQQLLLPLPLPLPLPPPPKSSRESSSEEQKGKQKQQQQKGKKRFRSKFSGEQKAKMAAFAERVGWRLQKKDDAETERFCREEVGVSRRVLKVWMHNNKHLKLRGQDQEEDQELEDHQQYYQPQPADQALGEEEKKKTTTTKKKKKEKTTDNNIVMS